MDVRPILLSFQTAIIAILFTFVLGTGVAYIVFRLKNRKLKILLNSLFTLPLVLPPTVFGFFLLTIFGVQQPVGQFLLDFFAIQVVFSWPATVIALTAFEQMDSELLAVAQTLGFSESRYFRKIALPLSMNGLLAGGVLAFARGLGEFGATTMLAGNIAGKTRTLPLAIYSAVASGDWRLANQYVVIMLLLCLIILFFTEFFSQRAWRRSE